MIFESPPERWRTSYHVPFLVKGGHLPRTRYAVDILFDGKHFHEFRAAFVRNVKTHGTGCTFSAAIAANLALGYDLVGSIHRAKRFVTGAIRQALKVGRLFRLEDMKRPLTGLVMGYALGIWIGSLTDWPVTTLLYLEAGLLGAFLLLNRTRFGIIALLAAVCAAGILSLPGKQQRFPRQMTSPALLEQRDQNVMLRGVIVSDTGYRDEPAETKEAERLRFELELKALQLDGQWQPTTGRVLVFVSESRKPEPLRYGDTDCLLGHLANTEATS